MISIAGKKQSHLPAKDTLLLALVCCGRNDFASSRATALPHVEAAAGSAALSRKSIQIPANQFANSVPRDDMDCRNVFDMRTTPMMRLAVLLASAAINAATMPSAASECISSRDVDTSRARWAAVRTQPTKVADAQTTCRTYAASFYESVKLRQEAALCSRDPDQTRNLTILDSEIDAFNNLLATKCGS